MIKPAIMTMANPIAPLTTLDSMISSLFVWLKTQATIAKDTIH
jgi:hypothetical protein